MISTCGSPPLFLTATAASRMARSLHLGDLGERDAETAAAQPEHRILLVQLFNACQQRTQLLELGRAGLGIFEVLDFDQQVFPLGQELVQRRIEQANGDGQADPWT